MEIRVEHRAAGRALLHVDGVLVGWVIATRGGGRMAWGVSTLERIRNEAPPTIQADTAEAAAAAWAAWLERTQKKAPTSGLGG